MSRNRFRQILTHIHFANNANMPPDGNQLSKVWYGRLMLKTYNPSKIKKYGILIRMLCDSATGYISSFKLYCGIGQSLNITIMELLRRPFRKWHHLYMYNLYNGVALAKELLLKQVRVCGTIRLDGGLPDSLKNAKLKNQYLCLNDKGKYFCSS
ncbi:uncharacterized protein LOC143429924 [Xylocopa sonorina]|uniref:uncharacterized protein LOC143429924 n=1 Tax=Xylocopa sonorina TaxID=1818115 RepID=UPI00403AFDAC